MTDIKITTRELTKEYKPYGLEQNKKIAKMGGHTAKVARDDLEKNLNIKVNEYLDINNGCVAEATFEDNQHINIGQIKYDTGSYLIIGTPIIFVTY